MCGVQNIIWNTIFTVQSSKKIRLIKKKKFFFSYLFYEIQLKYILTIK